MTSLYGLRFDNNGGAKVIDGLHLVPQFVGAFYMGNFPYVEETEVDGAHPGWTIRYYQVTPSYELGGRPCVFFVKLPETYNNVYVDSSGTVLAYHPGTNSYPQEHPTVYAFALDYVTQSGDNWGVRIKNESMQLMYDSGNLHMNLLTIMNGVSMDTTKAAAGSDYPNGYVRSFTMGDPMPVKACLVLPAFDMVYAFSRRFEGSGDWRANAFFKRRDRVLDTIVLRTQYTYNEGVYSNNSYSRGYFGGATNRTVLAIDGSTYD